ncbi:hypothetical protein QC763_608300 [Podospora pseudopauciseta]|uniref:chitinase n=1 Tax=Podospora pseudopauciseta TaxID=2093780 RepID=A0ABR0H5W0_9PEZI|nr:hypothetical protein QC763_608300 [Podospora pseudopauciseta]
MLLPVALALLGVKVPMVAAQGFEIPQHFEISGLPMDSESFPVVDAAARPQPDLSDPKTVEKLQQQWLEAAQRIPTELINRCPVACSSVGSDSLKWTTADLTGAGRESKRSLDNDGECAPVFQVETSTSLRLALTGGQKAPDKAAAGVVSSIQQISNHLESIVPSCGKNKVAFAHSGTVVVGLYVGAQAHRQGLAGDALDRLLARAEKEGFSDNLIGEVCESGYSADYVVGVVVHAGNDAASKVQQTIRAWSEGSCLAAGSSSQAVGEPIRLLVPAPSTPSAASSSSNHTTASSSNFTAQNRMHRARDSGSMFRGLAGRQEYCSNVKQVVAGNTCETIADKRCTISLDRFLSYNPGIDCKNLWVGQNVCCTEGATPPPAPLVPAPDPYCTNWKTVQADQTCEYMADKRCTVSLSTFKSRNPHLDCNNLKVGTTFCCNAGRVPPENECSNSKTVMAGNTCLQIADKRCTISIAKFIEYNPQLNCQDDNGLKIGEPFCCNYGRVPPPGPPPNADGTCKTAVVAEGDGCDKLATKCGIAGDYITQFNPQSGFCANLAEGQTYCCGRGSLPDLRPKKNADGSCFDYTIQPLDSCNKTAIRHQLTQADLFKFNKNTYGWNGCDNLQVNLKICLSEGTPPMPTVDETAVCGPTVLGTKRPANNTALADLNPCPLNVCCNHWGQCGMTHEFCSITKSVTGNPGTTTCVSNCGNEIIKSSPPADQMRIAYFEAWNGNRPCLRMNVNQIDTSRYTHIHFAFAEVSPTFEVVISHVQDEWDRFMTMTDVKKIISFGGWDFSVKEGTYRILRDAVKPANREVFRKNVVDFVNKYNLDGVDLDWEYPGAPDNMPTAGDPVEGLDYSTWLKSVRSTLPSSKTVSFAAPASYWYLKAFPISTMASYIDYVVYMTYDLHGQWDVGNKYAIDGCEAGNCLRSHVNITETRAALSMITKAGMPSNKVVVGVTSYGRSFRMAEKDCVDPLCTFTGDKENSEAAPGKCTRTRGYISNAEIESIIETNPSAISYHHDGTDYLVYNDYEWVAYMSEQTKAQRERYYESLNMRGSTDWAVDLQSFDTDQWYGVVDPLEGLEPDDIDLLFPNDCPERNFKTLEEIEKAKDVDAHCTGGYMIEALANMLEKAVSDYDAIMKTDYDKKFGYFAKAVKESWAAKLREFYYDSKVNNDDWYNCYKVGGSTKVSCPPKASQTTSVRMEVKNQKAFADHLMKEFSIDYADTMAGTVNLNLIPSGCVGTSPGNNYGNICGALPNPVGTEAIGVRLLREDLEIPNPKKEVGQSLENLRKLPKYLRSIVKLHRLGALHYETDLADVIDTTAPSVFMVQESVDAMKKAYEIGEDVEEEEKKRKQKDIIMWVLSAILFILPGAGQALAGFTRIAMIGRIASITAYTGGVAMSAYEVASDPENLVLGIFLVLVDLVPGVGSLKSTWKQGGAMRGKMTQADIDKMGPFVKNGLQQIDNIRQVCRRR